MRRRGRLVCYVFATTKPIDITASDLFCLKTTFGSLGSPGLFTSIELQRFISERLLQFQALHSTLQSNQLLRILETAATAEDESRLGAGNGTLGGHGASD